MRKGLSLRWRLILLSSGLAFLAALLLGSLLYVRAQRQLLQQLEKTLETKCDEVISVLKSAEPHPTLDDFLIIETNYRFTPYTYYYQISDAEGRSLVRSRNLGDVTLPTAERIPGATVHVFVTPHPLASESRILLRSERVELKKASGDPAILTIQTAVSLGPFEAAGRQTLRDAALFGTCALSIIFVLLWFVTTRSLEPVSVMTRKASQITAKDLRERLPLTGRDDELDDLARVLNDMLDRLGASLRQMEQFSSDAAHQLRTPLTRIRAEIELALRGEVPEPPRGVLARVHEEIERLSHLCGRLLLLARVDHQSQEASLLDERVDLDEVIGELLELMAPVAQDRGVGLSRGASQAVKIQGSRPLLVEALLNLLDNAIRATPLGGAVTVALERTDSRASLSVEDGGPGVPPEERQRIFQPFYRIPRASAGAIDDGAGLGLAIVKGIAQAHGGHIEVSEALQGGSVFRMVFPVSRTL